LQLGTRQRIDIDATLAHLLDQGRIAHRLRERLAQQRERARGHTGGASKAVPSAAPPACEQILSQSKTKTFFSGKLIHP
jgi:hypothetical protein